ncbi:hypothetical protein K488DRAFT_55477 [Vararia minispora EC-137]|uniref:Uncharacterized protein n=1 Tax=Vararia minispora EC-137 TaxID=1314806 RepID=A0ACB8QDP4_9AGAM|nr:hypothetical protein K488DRAFT_55477 [Vararia minispora EC-137]
MPFVCPDPCTELWIVYAQASRAHKPATAQLLDLAHECERIQDLEDVLDLVFTRGFVEAHLRTVCWWETPCGTRVPNGRTVSEVVASGSGHCAEHALKLVIADVPTALWVRYVYTHTPRAHTATQRIRLERTHEHLAHVTNDVFARGYLPARVRACVYWEAPCGRRVSEVASVCELLAAGEGTCEDRALRLIIGECAL